MWKWVYSADFHRLEYFQDFGDGKLLVGQSNEISEIWKNALEEDPEHPSLPQDDWWLLIKLCFSHLLHSDLRLLTIFWFTTKMIFFTVIFDKDNKLVFNFSVKNSFFLSRWLMASNKAMLFPSIAFRHKVANYFLVYYKADLFYCDSNKAILFPFIAFRPKASNYCLVHYKDDLFYCDFLDKNDKLVFNFKCSIHWIVEKLKLKCQVFYK